MSAAAWGRQPWTPAYAGVTVKKEEKRGSRPAKKPQPQAQKVNGGWRCRQPPLCRTIGSCLSSPGVRLAAVPVSAAWCRPWRFGGAWLDREGHLPLPPEALLRRTAFRARGCHMAFRADGFRLAGPALPCCLNLLLRVGFGCLAQLVIYLKSLPFPAGLSFGHK
ncbi:hypothetical protein ACFB49_20080 [Sphingomonas sp. DBB INV C78]